MHKFGPKGLETLIRLICLGCQSLDSYLNAKPIQRQVPAVHSESGSLHATVPSQARLPHHHLCCKLGQACGFYVLHVQTGVLQVN